MIMKKIFLVIFTFISLSTFSQTSGDIVDRLNASLGVRLPVQFEAKVKEFAANDTIMRTRSATAFTEQFIIEQFKNDWGINRQNQLLFMWSKIFGGISQKKLYNWLDDDNNERRSEYKKCLKNISEFYNSYKKGFKEYMEQQSAEADRRIDEAKRRSAETERRSAETERRSIITTYLGLKHDIEFYQLYKRNSSAALPNETSQVKNISKIVIQDCIKYNIDYHSLLPLEVQKFYNIELSGNNYNHATCEQAQVQIMKIVLKEIVKYYNLCQQAPQATHDKDLVVYFNTFKELGIDYKAILRKELGDDEKVQELLKFFGVE